MHKILQTTLDSLVNEAVCAYFSENGIPHNNIVNVFFVKNESEFDIISYSLMYHEVVINTFVIYIDEDKECLVVIKSRDYAVDIEEVINDTLDVSITIPEVVVYKYYLTNKL